MDETTLEETTEELHSIEEVDWEAEAKRLKAESRKWEQRSKENKAAAEELERIKAEQMTEQERLIARAEAAEQKIAQLESEAARKAAAERISAEKNVPVELLLYMSDEESMTNFADEYAAKQQIPSAPSAPNSRIVRDESAKVSNRDQFAADIKSLIK